MTLTSRTTVKYSNEHYLMFDEFSFKAKNLYNATLYKIRQNYFEGKPPLNCNGMDKALKFEKSIDYVEMPMASSAQWTVKNVFQDWDSFCGSKKAYAETPEKFHSKPKMPKYLHKTKGRAVVYLTNQNIVKKDGVLCFPKCFNGFTIPLEIEGDIKQVRVVPKNRHYVVEVVYEIAEIPLKEDNSLYLGLDLGLDNFVTAVSNDGTQPAIINGKGLKSINKRWNKRISHLREVETAMNGYEVATKTGITRVSNQTNQQIALTNKRNNQVNDFCHKASKKIVDYARERGCNTVIVGKNDGWKQESKMNTKVNQSFIQIPHTDFVNMLKYKCQKHGLNFITVDEAHTSKTSWMDDESPEHHEKYLGNRIKRGLFRTATGTLINADVNGALQIIRKVFPKAKADGIWACGQPIRVNVV